MISRSHKVIDIHYSNQYKHNNFSDERNWCYFYIWI